MQSLPNQLRKWLFPLGSQLNENLLRASLIISLRWVILLVEFVTAVTYGFLGKLLWMNYAYIVLSIVLLVIFNTIVTIFLKGKEKVSVAFLAFQLFVDLFQLFIFLKLVMSKTNPLIEIFYLPLIVSIIALPFVWNFVYSVVTVIMVSSFYLSKSADHHNYHHFYSHLFTMGLICLTLNLLMSFIRYFQMRFENVQNYKQRMDHLKVVGAMTSGFCHQMATPLNTIKLRLDRIGRNQSYSQDDLNSALMALGQCEVALKALSELRADKKMGKKEKIDVHSFCRNLIEHSYPEMKLKAQEEISVILGYPQLLTQTLLDLFDNASDASEEAVELSIHQDKEFVHFEVINFQSKISSDVLEKLGEPFNSTKEQGSGLGLFNAFNSALLMNGKFTIFNRDGNVHALLSLPIFVEEAQA